MSKENAKKEVVQDVIDQLVQKGHVALEKMETLNQEQVDKIVYEMSLAAIDQHMPLAKICLPQKVFGIILNIIKQLA
jgi:acetaldehyde dehydrogenase/alcohol dehydrogenase